MLTETKAFSNVINLAMSKIFLQKSFARACVKKKTWEKGRSFGNQERSIFLKLSLA